MSQTLASETAPYVGRFAPSPSGPLHAGSLLAAVASWLDARAHGGRWILRIEDIDTPRCDPAHAQRIIETLAALGLEWDGPVVFQSERLDRYEEVFAELRQAQLIYPCSCTRAMLRAGATGPAGERVYPGSCRDGLPSGTRPRTWRLRLDDAAHAFDDRVLGPQLQHPATDCGDFIVRRADGLFAYQLVVVIDDLDQGITDVVRGADLLSSCGRQLALIRALNSAPPTYLHLPLLRGQDGSKLSKQNGATEIDWRGNPSQCLADALRALGQESFNSAPVEMLDTAIRQWDIRRVPRADCSIVDESGSDHDDSPD